MTKEQKSLYMKGYNAAMRSMGRCTWCRSKHRNGTLMCKSCQQRANDNRRGSCS